MSTFEPIENTELIDEATAVDPADSFDDHSTVYEPEPTPEPEPALDPEPEPDLAYTDLSQPSEPLPTGEVLPSAPSVEAHTAAAPAVEPEVIHLVEENTGTEQPPPPPPGLDQPAPSEQNVQAVGVTTPAETDALPTDRQATDWEAADWEAADSAGAGQAERWTAEYEQWHTMVTTTGRSPLGGIEPDDALASTSVVGEPFADSEFWFRQNTTFTCGPASATQIISDFTGNVSLREDALYAYADQQGWMVDIDRDGDIDGMSIEHLSQLLADHGVPNQVVSGDFDDLATYLSQGRSIVLFLDNENLPGMVELDGVENSFQDDPNHFVRLTGIDLERGIAYLSDPGRPDGQNLVVPLDLLEEAWNDSNNYMVVTDGSDPTPDGETWDETATPTPEPEPIESSTEPVVNGEPPANEAPAGAEVPTAKVASTPAPTQPVAVTPVPVSAPTPAPAPSAVPVPNVAIPAFDLGIGEQVNDLLEAATKPVDLTTPPSQPDGLFDSAKGFVLLPLAVSAGVAATLGYSKLRSAS